MKYLRVLIRKGAIGQNAMIYPSIWNGQEIDRSKIGPLLYDQGIGNGDATEFAVCLVEDSVADSYAASSSDLSIRTEGQVNTWLNGITRVQDTPEEQVTDPDRIQSIIAKNGAGIALSTEDLAAMDPDDNMRGINRRLKTATAIFSARRF